MNKKFYILAVLAVMLILPKLSFSQDSNLGNWLIYFGNKKINNKFNLHHEVQYRNYNMVGDLEQLLLRTGLGYNLSPNNNNLLMGYGYILSENYNGEEKVSVSEHRIFQQFITNQSFGRWSIQHRYRIEQRWVESIFKWRFRYFLAVNYLLAKSETSGLSYYLSMYNEIFIQPHDNAFDRNRVYGAFGVRLNKSLAFELGYMNQYFDEGGRDQINAVIRFNF